MKNLNFLVIFFIIFLAFCTEKKKESPDKNKPHAIPDTVKYELKYLAKFLPESPFRIPIIRVKNNEVLEIKNTTDFNATFIIPNSNKLFTSNEGYDSLMVDNVQYLLIPIPAKKKEKFHIRSNANPDTIEVIYPFSAFCKNGTIAAERESSPIIIVEP